MLLNSDDPAASQFSQFSVNLASLTSDQPERDEALRKQWLESGGYPMALFLVKKVRNLPAQPAMDQPVPFQLAGEMTIKDVTRPLVWDVAATLWGERLVGRATASLTLADFGQPIPRLAGIPEVVDGVSVVVDFTFQKVKPQPPGGCGLRRQVSHP